MYIAQYTNYGRNMHNDLTSNIKPKLLYRYMYMYICVSPPNHSPGWLWCAVAPVRSLSLTEPYLRLIRTQESLRLQCSRWHGDVGEELGFKDVLIRIVRVSEAGTAVDDALPSDLYSS